MTTNLDTFLVYYKKDKDIMSFQALQRGKIAAVWEMG